MIKKLSNFLRQTLGDLPQRSRVLATVGASLLIFLIWYFFIFSTLSSRLHEAGLNLQRINGVRQNAEMAYPVYLALSKKPGEFQAQEVARLREVVAAMSKNPNIRRQRAETPEALQAMLAEIASPKSKISVSHLEVLSPSAEGGSGKKIQVEFYGDYFGTLGFFDYLEKLPWSFVFDSLKYQVQNYPNAKVKLVLDAGGKA